jgi:glucose-1-phosphate cytidylyltransferase
MKVVILCGGYGTRIRDVAEDIPKPMILVGQYPILWHIMKHYAQAGHTEFILCLGYKGNAIKEFFLNYEALTRDFTINLGEANRGLRFHTGHGEVNWQVTLADTGKDAMTGARIRKIRDYIYPDKDFLLTYGDGVSDVNIEELIRFHHQQECVVTVTGVRPPGRFGEIVVDANGKASEFNEKPQVTGGRISGGYFVCRREIFDYLVDREDLVFEQGPMRQLVNDQQMAVFEHDGFWQCMDTYRDWQYLNGLYEKGAAPWVNW